MKTDIIDITTNEKKSKNSNKIPEDGEKILIPMVRKQLN